MSTTMEVVKGTEEHPQQCHECDGQFTLVARFGTEAELQLCHNCLAKGAEALRDTFWPDVGKWYPDLLNPKVIRGM